MESIPKPSLQQMLATVAPLSLNQKVSEAHLVEIARALIDWRSVCTSLGISEAEETTIEEDNQRAAARKRAVLRQWKSKYGPNATYRNLAKCFYSAEKLDMVEAVCQVLGAPSSPVKVKGQQQDWCCTITGDNSIHGSVTNNSNQELQSSLHHECSNARTAKGVNTGLTDVLSKQASFQQLSYSQKEELLAKLYDDEETMKLRFGSLVTKTRDSVEKQTTVVRFVGSILALGAYEPAPEGRDRSLLDEHREEIKKAETISEIFIILSAYWNYLNYEILEYIINHYGTSDDISRLECYNEELCEFCKRRLFELIENGGGTDSIPNQKQAKFVVKLDVREDITYKEVIRIRRRIAKILCVNLAAFIISQVDVGCVQLTFLIPKFVAQEIFPLSDEQTSALSRDESMIRLECGEYVFKITSETCAEDQSTLSLELEALKGHEPSSKQPIQMMGQGGGERGMGSQGANPRLPIQGPGRLGIPLSPPTGPQYSLNTPIVPVRGNKMDKRQRCDYLFVRHTKVSAISPDLPRKLYKKWTHLWVVLSTEISPSNCCLSYCKNESDWLLNSQSITKCFLGDFSVMRTQAGYSKKHDNVLLVIFSSYTFNLAFESMTKMDEWYSSLQALTMRHHVDLVRSPEHPEMEGEYVVEVDGGTYRVWVADGMPKPHVKWEWHLKHLRRIHWHKTVNKLEVEAGRMADTGEGHFFFTGQHALRLFEVIKVMMISQSQQTSSSTTISYAATPTSSPRHSSSQDFSSTQPAPSGPRQPLLPPSRGRAQFASGHESEEETEEEWTGTGASSDSGISGSGLRHSLRKNSTPISPIAVSSPVLPPVPLPLPPRDPVDLSTQANHPELLGMAGLGYMKLDVKTMNTESKYMILPKREHNYEAISDQREGNPPSPDSYCFVHPRGIPLQVGSPPPVPSHAPPPRPIHRSQGMDTF